MNIEPAACPSHAEKIFVIHVVFPSRGRAQHLQQHRESARRISHLSTLPDFIIAKQRSVFQDSWYISPAAREFSSQDIVRVTSPHNYGIPRPPEPMIRVVRSARRLLS